MSVKYKMQFDLIQAYILQHQWLFGQLGNT